MTAPHPLTTPTSRALLAAAYDVAQLSPDPSTQNGAVILAPRGRNCTTGYNGPTPGIHYNPNTDRDHRMLITEHAERTAIYNAAREGLPLNGAIMACPWAACAECARAIASTGITALIRHTPLIARTPERWLRSIAVADSILLAAGVKIIVVDGPIDAPTIRHNGTTFNPRECG